MEQHPTLPSVETVAVIIRRDEEILLVFNEKWSAFTLPMTKVRQWTDPNIPPARREEKPAAAAVRAAAECLGKTLAVQPTHLKDIRGYRQSDRDGVWKEYVIHVFTLPLPEEQPEKEPWSGIRSEWLTADEILEGCRGPISPTARDVILQTRAGNP